MAFGDLKVQDLIYEDNSNNEITVVLSDLVSKASPAFTGTVTGVNLTLSGDLQVNGTTTTINTTILQVEDKNIEIGKVASPSDTTADGGGWSLLGSTTKTFNWVNSTDAWTSSEHVHLGDDKRLFLGTGLDLQIYHDGSHSYLTNSTGNTYLRGDGSSWMYIQAKSGEHSIIAKPNGSVDLYYDDSKKFETSSLGVHVTGNATFSGAPYPISDDAIQLGLSNRRWQKIWASDEINVKDNGKIQAGDSNDLQIYHDGNDSYILENTGNLHIRGSSNGQKWVCISALPSEYNFVAKPNGATELYYDGNRRAYTSSDGLRLDDNLRLEDSKQIRLGTGEDFKLYHNGTNNILMPVNGDIIFDNGSNELARITQSGTVSDSKGDVRKIIQNTQGSAYTLVAADAGKHILASGNVTVQNSTFVAGEAVTIVNNTGGDISIVKAINDMYWTQDGTDATRILGTRGMATILFTSSSQCYISGSPLS